MKAPEEAQHAKQSHSELCGQSAPAQPYSHLLRATTSGSFLSIYKHIHHWAQRPSTTGPKSHSVFVTPLKLQPLSPSPCPVFICRPVPEKEVQSV